MSHPHGYHTREEVILCAKQELGLRDMAVFEGWVLPPPAEEAERGQAAGTAPEQSTTAEQRPAVTALPSIHHR